MGLRSGFFSPEPDGEYDETEETILRVVEVWYKYGGDSKVVGALVFGHEPAKEESWNCASLTDTP